MIIAAKMWLTPLIGPANMLHKHYLPSSPSQWDWLAWRESVSCCLPAGSEHKMNSELSMPSERGNGPHARSRCTHDACRRCSSQIKSTGRFDLIFFCFRLRIGSRVKNIFDNKTSWGF